MSVIKKHEEDIKCVIENIVYGGEEELKDSEAILNNPQLHGDQHYTDPNNVSAVAHAVVMERDKFYELFISKGLRLCPFEDIEKLTDGQPRKKKKKYRDINRKYFKDSIPKHLLILLHMSKLSHDASENKRQVYAEKIFKAFEELNSLEFLIEPILKVVSTSTNLKIVFDFNCNSVVNLDPSKSRDVLGTTYPKYSCIYIGAKGFEKDENRCEIIGTLIHEMSHFAMNLLYNNDCRPYLVGNSEKFEEIVKVIGDKVSSIMASGSSNCDGVFTDPASLQHAELIVRVPHLATLYKDEEEQFKKVSEELKELFQFYRDYILVDLQREYPLMEARQELINLYTSSKILQNSDIELSSQGLEIDFNRIEIDSNDNILFISSNCSQLTMCAITQKLRVGIERGSIMIMNLKTLQDDKLFSAAVDSISLCTKPKLLIDCQGVVKFDEVNGIVKKLNVNKINQKVIFLIDKKFKDSCDAKPFEIVHSWHHLTTTFQEKLLGEKIDFLGTEMVIGELLNDLSSIQSIPFHDLLDNQTIVIGKNLKFETEKLIERKFLPPNSKSHFWEEYTIEHDLNELLALSKKHQTILISDEPGMGKSTSLQMLYIKLRQKIPTFWPVFMDLKDHFKAYQDSCLEVRKREDIAKFLTEKCLRIKSFEAEIFTQLFNEDRVVFLMDGLDEICPSYKQFIFSLMKDIQKWSKNQLWISTRPHLADELKKELNLISFALKPLTEANRREFFENHFIGDPNFELILEEIESFLFKLKPRNQFPISPKISQMDYVCNPLIIKMILEILDENRSLKLSEANLFIVYDRFTRKMIEKTLEKGPEARKDFANSFCIIVKFYQQQAFLACFGERANTSMRQFDHIKKPLINEIVRIGLMFSNSPENLHFIHRTFSEFYVAKFFNEEIFNFTDLRVGKYLNPTIEFLLENVLGNEKFSFVTVLLDNAIDYNKKITGKDFPQSTLKVVKENMELKHFEFLVTSGCYNLIELFVLHLHPGGRKLLFSRERPNLVMVAVNNRSVDFVKRFFDLLQLLNAEELKKMLFEQDKYDRNALSLAALNPYSEVFEYIIKLYESFMTIDELNELLMRKYEFVEDEEDVLDYTNRSSNILYSAIENDRHVDIIINVLTLKLSPAQRKTMLLEDYVVNSYDDNLLQCAVEDLNSITNFECLLSFIREFLDSQDLENFLLHENDAGLKAFDLALLKGDEFVFGTIKEFYLEVFGESYWRKIIFDRNECKNWFQKSNFYFKHICSLYEIRNDGVFKVFISFIMELFPAHDIQKDFFLIRNDQGETFLEFAIKRLEEDDFAFLCSLLDSNDRAEILQQTNSRGECAFHSAAKLDDLERFRKVRQMYEESFNTETFKQMIVCCDKSWISDVADCYASSTYIYGTFLELCHSLRELFKSTDETERLKDFFLFADDKEFEYIFWRYGFRKTGFRKKGIPRNS